MKLAAYILWTLGLCLLCLVLWVALAGSLWDGDHRIIPLLGATATMLVTTASYLHGRARRRDGVDPSPPLEITDERRRRWATAGGVGVILVTGWAAFGDGRGFFNGSPVNALLGLFVIAVTLGGAFALHRFIARHGDEIGEARFDTRNREEG